ncbi:helix-turn-helix transcriptional regulator [Niveispirillum sp. BGYR6]|uniref:helix-turn-helix domain-containing protein n=1 Tax=Niveispirillum sp. BGYR6 TaxID=2971249 RepID=UPI0022B9985A|nr:helix-turn-helix transcriptional regulator [Niveispirillum sp. BGYR6]MDG5497970.1 helix-turn-helix transcriptional regulator [Niveispirillum sp. BGYR6]
MYTHPQHGGGEEVKELRRRAGAWLKNRRTEVGLTQRALAEAVGLEYYTMVSMIEAGRGRIPPDSYLAWASALQMAPAEFVRTLMQFYDPITHAILFGEPGDIGAGMADSGAASGKATKFRVV